MENNNEDSSICADFIDRRLLHLLKVPQHRFRLALHQHRRASAAASACCTEQHGRCRFLLDNGEQNTIQFAFATSLRGTIRVWLSRPGGLWHRFFEN
jgi:hypothetical protein